MAKISSSIKWVAALSVVFFLILATNLIDRQHFTRVRDSVVTIYEDRLVVKDIIYRISLFVGEKRLALAKSNSDFFTKRNQMVNDSIQTLIQDFYTTKLTSDESRHLRSLDENVTAMQRMEIALLEDGDADPESDLGKALETQYLVLKKDLKELSKIQLAEGKRQVFIANESVDLIDLFTRIEIIMLVVIGLIIQLIILFRLRG